MVGCVRVCVCVCVCVRVCCRRWLCVNQLPKLEGLIHLSHASLGNAGSLIKDWIFHGGFSISQATCSLSFSLSCPLSSQLSHFVCLFFFIHSLPICYLHLLLLFHPFSPHHIITPLTLPSSHVSPCFCLVVSFFPHTDTFSVFALTHCSFYSLFVFMLSCQQTGIAEILLQLLQSRLTPFVTDSTSYSETHAGTWRPPRCLKGVNASISARHTSGL